MAPNLKRIGIFGGSFDPPHIGHLLIAEMAWRSCELDVVYFVPAYRPPHKAGAHPSTARDRFAMTKLSIQGNRKLRVSDIELRRKGVSYTVDTVRAFRAKYSRAQLFLIIGSDSLRQFHSWKSPGEILAEASLIVYRRPRVGRPHTLPRSASLTFVAGPLMDISSSEIRKRIQEGKSIRYIVRDTVFEFIEAKMLYSDRQR